MRVKKYSAPTFGKEDVMNQYYKNASSVWQYYEESGTKFCLILSWKIYNSHDFVTYSSLTIRFNGTRQNIKKSIFLTFLLTKFVSFDLTSNKWLILILRV